MTGLFKYCLALAVILFVTDAQTLVDQCHCSPRVGASSMCYKWNNSTNACEMRPCGNGYVCDLMGTEICNLRNVYACKSADVRGWITVATPSQPLSGSASSSTAPSSTLAGSVAGSGSPTPAPASGPSPSPTSSLCSTGMFLTPDGSCSSDPCAACPVGTACVVDKNDPTKMVCRDCSCGFCQSASFNFGGCCETNANGNNCKSAGTREKVCLRQDEFYPGYAGTSGDGCSGEETVDVPEWCECSPSNTAVCNFAAPREDKCYVCTTDDLKASVASCSRCSTCLVQECNLASISDYLNCGARSSTIPQCSSLDTCRNACRNSCFKVF